MDAPAAAVRIGVVDSGASPVQAARVRAAAAFVFEDGALCRVAAQPDRLGHGSRLLDIIGLLAPDAELWVAQVFRERLATSAAQVAAAIDWLVGERVQLINLSLGLREPRPVLAEACARALAAGVILCASAPARGAPVYPAAFPGVLRMTGDARCGRLEISALGTQYADFGAHVRPRQADAAPGMAGSGASMGCAHLCGHIGRYLAGGGRAEPAAVRQWLSGQARYHGAEHRRS